jgi:hypothetical protein
MAAASITVRALLFGPRQVAQVVAATPRALYLAVIDLTRAEPAAAEPVSTAPALVAVLTPDAVRVPIGIVLDVGALAQRVASGLVPIGTEAVVGEGMFTLGGLGVRPLRWWDPGVPRLPALGVESAAALLRQLPAPPEEIAAALPAFANALRDDPQFPVVRDLVGRGPGLTPAGDDVLAGTLCALAAARPAAPTRRALSAAVLALMHRTTPVSAALLAEGVHGRTVPQVADLLRALGRPDDEHRLGSAVRALAGVGATSGVALGHGLAIGLAIGLASGAGTHQGASVPGTGAAA